jgi:hypothetical protein
LNFTFAQVSKWNWDRRKKDEAGNGAGNDANQEKIKASK